MKHWIRRSLVLVAVACPVLAHADTPAGLGGFIWRTATPQPNNLHSVVAATPGSGGVGLLAAGDASTLVNRRTPLNFGNFVSDRPWQSLRQQAKPTNVSFRGVSALRSLSLVGACTSDGHVLIGNGIVMRSAAMQTNYALNAIGFAKTTGPVCDVATVGEHGSAYVSTDSGATFHASSLDSSLPAAPDLYALRFPLVNGTPSPIGYAAGECAGAGVALKTTDGGQTWTKLSSTVPADVFMDVFFVDAQNGFLLGIQGGAGFVEATTDGGETWTLKGFCDGSVRALGAFNTQNLVLVGGTGLTISNDGGQTFSSITEPIEHLSAPIALEAVDLVPGTNEAWAVGEAGVIFHSTDGNGGWTAVSDIGLDGSQLEDIYAAKYLNYPSAYIPPPNGATVLAVGAHGAFLRSLNGGILFQPIQEPPTSETLFSLAVPGGRNTGSGGVNGASQAVTVGSRGTMGVYTPSANALILHGGVPNVDYLAVATAGSGSTAQAWAVGRSGTIVYDPDGGPFWTQQTTGVTSDLNALSVVAPRSGPILFAVGDLGVILKSADGLHWGPTVAGGSVTPLRPASVHTNLHGVVTTTGGLTVVVGDNGFIARSGDGGATWTYPLSGTMSTLRAVTLAPGGASAVFYAVGDSQAVLRSTDGGMTWTQLPLPVPGIPGAPPPSFSYRSVQFLSIETGVIAGDEGHILLTSTAASSWTEIGGSGADSFYGFELNSSGLGVAVGGNAFTGGEALVTVDKGSDFSTAALPPGVTVNLNGVDVNGASTIIVGDAGTIIRATDISNGAANATFSTETSDVRTVVSPIAGLYAAGGDNGLLLYSSDGGTTWQRAGTDGTVGPGVQINAMGFAPVDQTTGLSTGWAAGSIAGSSAPVLLRSSDSGRDWVPAALSVGADAAPINALGVISASSVLAAAANGAVYVYDGETWTAQHPIPGFTGQWKGVLAGDSRYYIAGDNGMIARFPSANGVMEWQSLNSGVADNLLSVSGPPAAALPRPYGGGDSLHDDICNYTGLNGIIADTSVGGYPTYGDTNADTLVSLVDAASVLRFAAGLAEPSVYQYFMGDVWSPAPSADVIPGDGYLDILDAVKIIRIANGN